MEINMPTSVALGNHFEDFIKQQLASGRFNNTSEVIREGLRMLEDQEKLRQLKLEVLRSEIMKGVNSGSTKPADEVLDRLEKKYRKMAEREAH
jgi:antitoxin ParD1/3/4